MKTLSQAITTQRRAGTLSGGWVQEFKRGYTDAAETWHEPEGSPHPDAYRAGWMAYCEQNGPPG